MIVKRIDGVPSNTKESLCISSLTNLKDKDWIYTDEGWILKPVETSKNEVSND